jgi:hypothetical protein
MTRPHSEPKPNPQDWLGQAIILQCVLQQLRSEISGDFCREHPLIITMALEGLQAQFDRFVNAITEAIE